MPAQARQFLADDRFAAKELARRADERSVESGQKSLGQAKRDNESFAFGKDRARVNLKSARSLV